MGMHEKFGDGTALVEQLVGLIRTDGLADQLAGFNDAGAEAEVQSWVGSIENEATDKGAVERAIGRTRLSAIAASLDVDPEEVAGALARVIPTVVDRLTPGGSMPTGAQLDELDAGSLLTTLDLRALLA